MEDSTAIPPAPVKGTKLAVPRGASLRERLLARIRVNETTGCWEWTLSLNSTGYGLISMGRREDGTGLVHKVAWELWRGPVPEGMELDHLCHTRDPNCSDGVSCPHRRCCNPEHLEPVSCRENVRRSTNPFGLNAIKTHCKYGHEFTPENTHITREGWRQCKACRRLRSQQAAQLRKRRRAAAKAA